MTNGRNRVLADAAARGLAVEIVERPIANSLEEAAAMLGIAQRHIVKTLVVRAHDDRYLFALVPGDRQISWPKLRAVVGVNRLAMPSPELASEATGYERGTITPIGSLGRWPVYADASIIGSRVALGAGEHGYSAFVDSDALCAAYDATIADISG